ncbi:MAG: putative addiction module antidote protein [Coriobacteriales bacterium]|jgi:probable addiction module antidote protein|nr:putative addiction module antidote protein [Coriobacteriales bacterium]
MRTKVKLTIWDPAEHLDNDEAMALYLEAAFAENDAALIAAALGDIARAKGMSDIARKTGLARESLYRSLSPEGNPEMGTILKVMDALGLKLSVSA